MNSQKLTQMLIISLLTVLTFSTAVNQIQAKEMTDINFSNKQFIVRTLVPQGIPLTINQGVTTNINEGKQLRFFVTNDIRKSLSEIHFVAFIVDQKGKIKSGQGWMLEKKIAGLTSSEVRVNLKHLVELGDQIVLTAYKAIGKTKKFEVMPQKVLGRLADKNLIVRNKKFIQTVGKNLSPQQDTCASARQFATDSCSCGIESFSCNPQTGEFSFDCFSEQENPSCAEGDPET